MKHQIEVNAYAKKAKSAHDGRQNETAERPDRRTGRDQQRQTDDSRVERRKAVPGIQGPAPSRDGRVKLGHKTYYISITYLLSSDALPHLFIAQPRSAAFPRTAVTKGRRWGRFSTGRLCPPARRPAFVLGVSGRRGRRGGPGVPALTCHIALRPAPIRASRSAPTKHGKVPGQASCPPNS